MKISGFFLKARVLAPVFALIALLVVTMIFENAVPTVVVNSEPTSGRDCYCHKGLAQEIIINGTRISSFFPNVVANKPFTLLVKAVFSAQTSTGETNQLEWTPTMDDNAKFTFDPSQVAENSPQNQNPTPNTIVALFKVTAPNETGTYFIALSYGGELSEILLRVTSGPASYAAITHVDAPLASKAGDIVSMNVTLQNNGSVPSRFYMYATNSSTGPIVFNKVYSQAPITSNGTTVLRVAFEMPNGSLALMIRSGHVEGTNDIDDGRSAVYILQSLPPPPIQVTPFSILAIEWAPWVAAIAASLGSVPLIGMYAGKGKRLLPKSEKLKFAVVECAGCSVCKDAIEKFGESTMSLPRRKVEFVKSTPMGSRGPIDVALVMGSIRTEKDIKIVTEARDNARVLVAFGACSAFGELAAEDRRRTDAIARGLREPISQQIPQPTDEIKPVSDYVKVDLMIPGCPPSIDAIRYAIDALQYQVTSEGRTNETQGRDGNSD